MTTTPWRSGALTDRASCVLAPNPGVMTLEGTNTWVLREPGVVGVTVVDPGPDDPDHLEAILAAATADGGVTSQILLTHHHRDHTDAVPALVAATGAPVRGAGHGEPFGDRERLTVSGLEIEVVLTPGHTADSVCFLLPADRLLLTGDTILGRGTTVIAYGGERAPGTAGGRDGDLGDYLRTLETLLALVESGAVERLGPGHGPAVAQPAEFLTGLRRHRLARLDEVRAAVEAGALGVEEVVDAVYGPIAADRQWAATHSVRAQLAYLGIAIS